MKTQLTDSHALKTIIHYGFVNSFVYARNSPASAVERATSVAGRRERRGKRKKKKKKKTEKLCVTRGCSRDFFLLFVFAEFHALNLPGLSSW